VKNSTRALNAAESGMRQVGGLASNGEYFTWSLDDFSLVEFRWLHILLLFVMLPHTPLPLRLGGDRVSLLSFSV
jgi:hypothetical protein